MREGGRDGTLPTAPRSAGLGEARTAGGELNGRQKLTMNRRRLGRTELAVAELGLGTEYLLDTSAQNVDRVIRTAVDAGAEYIDFFYAQPDIRDWMGRALDGIRDRVILAGHLGPGELNGQYCKLRDVARSQEFFEDLLRRLGTEYVDVLFLHNADSPEDTDLALGPFLERVNAYREQGRARFIGFSGHTPATTIRAVESGQVDVLMYPIHLEHHGDSGRDEVLSACAARDVGLVGMKVFAGGKLLRERADQGVTPVPFLAYALSRPAVSTVVPGPAGVEELRQSLAFIDAPPEERDFAALLPAGEGGAQPASCVYCNHCLPCPSGIDIGAVSRALDAWDAGHAEWARREYGALSVPASACVRCGKCAERCPWAIDAPGRMEQAAAEVENGQASG